jgi:hypothetical protein
VVSVIGVLGSAAVAAIVSYHQTRRGFDNLTMELRERYSNALHLKRLDVYPALYCIVSDLGKAIFEDALTAENVAEGLTAVNEWDSKYAIFTSPATTMALLHLRQVLTRYSNAPSSTLLDPEATENVRGAILRIEQAVKKELGIYDVTDFHRPEERDGYE